MSSRLVTSVAYLLIRVVRPCHFGCGLQGGSPPDPVNDIGRLSAKQAGMREKMEQVAKKLEGKGVSTTRLKEGIKLLEEAVRDLQDRKYSDAAKNIINSHLPGAAGTSPCGIPVAGAVWPPLNIAVGSGNSCSPDFSLYQVGSRTQFNPHPLMDIGLDVCYTKLNTAYKGTSLGIFPANGARPAVGQIDDQGVWSGIVRWQRNFYP